MNNKRLYKQVKDLLWMNDCYLRRQLKN